MRRKHKGQLTRAITHIALTDTHRGKLALLDALWEEFRPLCEQYVAYFCKQVAPDANLDFAFASVLSARWQRVVVQQAAGMAQWLALQSRQPLGGLRRPAASLYALSGGGAYQTASAGVDRATGAALARYLHPGQSQCSATDG